MLPPDPSAPPDKAWLRLSIGATAPADLHHHPQPPHFHFPTPATAAGLKPNQSFPLPNWTFTPISSCTNSSPPNSSSFIPFGPYFSRPFQLHPRLHLLAPTSTAGPSSDSDVVTVIDPPRRPHSGIWFSLQPLELNQGKQPALPQISSSYLRIKDGTMTVRLLIKYLVKKLRLESESEVEIWCRGEKLEGWLTMQHIRDNIWRSKHSSFTTLLPHSSTIHHIMLLHYATPS